jgi:periplasmic protein CpxP/Spy
MNRTKLLTIAVIGLLLLNFGLLGMMILRKPPGLPHGEIPHHEGGPKRIIIERLHLDAAQQSQYETLIEEHRSASGKLNEASRELHKDLYTLLAADPVDTAKADSLILQIAENQKATDKLNFAHFQDIKALCKADQLAEFKLLTEELAGLFAPKGPPPPPHQ